MIRTPAHKQTNGSKLPGQIVAAPQKAPGMTKNFDRHPYLKHSTADQTLGDYYKRKMDVPPKKLTFEEWAVNQLSKMYSSEPITVETVMTYTLYGVRLPILKNIWEEAQKNV